jgi:hypothetical protein
MAKKKKIKSKKLLKRKVKRVKRIKTKRKSNKYNKKRKSSKKLSKRQIARKRLVKLLKSPNFFVLASHPVMYKRPPKFIRDKTTANKKSILGRK